VSAYSDVIDVTTEESICSSGRTARLIREHRSDDIGVGFW
jgi:hypothetical protein